MSRRESFFQLQDPSLATQPAHCKSGFMPLNLHNSFLSKDALVNSSVLLRSLQKGVSARNKASKQSPMSRISASASTSLPSITIGNYSPEPFLRLGECFILTPAIANPKILKPKPKGVIAFFGGAFVGAVPTFTYRFLLEQLASAGYLIVAVPYQLTFDHRQSASVVEKRLQDCLELLYAQEGFGIGSVQGLRGSELKELPVFGVGHR
jgi:hypothetical protein